MAAWSFDSQCHPIVSVKDSAIFSGNGWHLSRFVGDKAWHCKCKCKGGIVRENIFSNCPQSRIK